MRKIFFLILFLVPLLSYSQYYKVTRNLNSDAGFVGVNTNTGDGASETIMLIRDTDTMYMRMGKDSSYIFTEKPLYFFGEYLQIQQDFVLKKFASSDTMVLIVKPNGYVDTISLTNLFNSESGTGGIFISYCDGCTPDTGFIFLGDTLIIDTAGGYCESFIRNDTLFSCDTTVIGATGYWAKYDGMYLTPKQGENVVIGSSEKRPRSKLNVNGGVFVRKSVHSYGGSGDVTSSGVGSVNAADALIISRWVNGSIPWNDSLYEADASGNNIITYNEVIGPMLFFTGQIPDLKAWARWVEANSVQQFRDSTTYIYKGLTISPAKRGYTQATSYGNSGLYVDGKVWLPTVGQTIKFDSIYVQDTSGKVMTVHKSLVAQANGIDSLYIGFCNGCTPDSGWYYNGDSLIIDTVDRYCPTYYANDTLYGCDTVALSMNGYWVKAGDLLFPYQPQLAVRIGPANYMPSASLFVNSVSGTSLISQTNSSYGSSVSAQNQNTTGGAGITAGGYIGVSGGTTSNTGLGGYFTNWQPEPSRPVVEIHSNGGKGLFFNLANSGSYPISGEGILLQRGATGTNTISGTGFKIKQVNIDNPLNVTGYMSEYYKGNTRVSSVDVNGNTYARGTMKVGNMPILSGTTDTAVVWDYNDSTYKLRKVAGGTVGALTYADTLTDIATQYDLTQVISIESDPIWISDSIDYLHKSDTNTKVSSRYWVNNQGFLKVEGDASVSNEGSLNVITTNTYPSINSNTSGSTPIEIRNGPAVGLTWNNPGNYIKIDIDTTNIILSKQLASRTYQKITDTSTKDATRYWVGQQGFLVSEVDGSTSNEIQNLSYNSSTHAIDIDKAGTSAIIPLATTSNSGLLTSAQATILYSDSIKWAAKKDYGFADVTETTISFNDATHIFTLAPVSTTWTYMRAGKVYTITGSKTVNLDDSPGGLVNGSTYFIIIDNTTGTLTASTDAWTLADTKVPVATIRWHGGRYPKYFLAEERHQAGFGRMVHRNLHFTRGAQMVSGGLVADAIVSGTTNDDNTISITDATIADEDLFILATSLPDGDGAGGDYLTMYHNGGSWTWDTTDMPYKFAAGGYIYYDNGTDSVVGGNNKFYNSYLAITDWVGQGRHIIFLGRGEFNSATAAYSENPFNFDWTGIPIQEIVTIYQMTWESGNAYTTKGKVRLTRLPQRLFGTISTTVGSTPTVVANTPLYGNGSTGSPLSIDTLSGQGVATQYDLAIHTQPISRVTGLQDSLTRIHDTIDNYIPKYIVDAAGDLVVGTGNNTIKRLARGSADQVLKVNAGGTDIEWGAAAASMVYPGAGIPVSTGSAWTTSITNNSANWNTAYGWGNHASAGYDNSVTNEGSLSVGSGTGSTSVINSNTSSSTGITLTAGTGLGIAENVGAYSITLTNTSPDKTVSLTNGTAISITGTYPSFTINNSSPDQIVALTNGTGISITGTYPNFTVTNLVPDSSSKYIPKYVIDAAGDLIVGTGNNTLNRLAKGNALQILRVNSGGTALEWADVAAGGVTSVSGTSPVVSSGGNTPAISINSDTLTSWRGKQNHGETAYGWGNWAGHTQAISTVRGLQDSLTDKINSINDIGTGPGKVFHSESGGNVYLRSIYGGTGIAVVNMPNYIEVYNNGVTGLSGTSPIAVSASTGSIAVSIKADTLTSWRGKQNHGETAFGWGNHASAGYLTSQTSHTDVVVDGDFTSEGLMKRGASGGTYSIVTDNSANWNTAYGWGNWAGHTQAISTVTGLQDSLTRIHDTIDNYIPKHIIDAAGDLIVGSSNNVPVKLAKGNALQTLRVNSGGTALEWADPKQYWTLGGNVVSLDPNYELEMVNSAQGTSLVRISNDVASVEDGGHSRGLQIEIPADNTQRTFTYIRYGLYISNLAEKNHQVGIYNTSQLSPTSTNYVGYQGYIAGQNGRTMLLTGGSPTFEVSNAPYTAAKISGHLNFSYAGGGGASTFDSVWVKSTVSPYNTYLVHKSLIGTGSGLAWSDTLTKIATAYDLSQISTSGVPADSIPLIRNSARGVSYLRNINDSVGLGTITPQARLDVNGWLKVRKVPVASTADSMLTIENGIFKSINYLNLGFVFSNQLYSARCANVPKFYHNLMHNKLFRGGDRFSTSFSGMGSTSAAYLFDGFHERYSNNTISANATGVITTNLSTYSEYNASNGIIYPQGRFVMNFYFPDGVNDVAPQRVKIEMYKSGGVNQWMTVADTNNIPATTAILDLWYWGGGNYVTQIKWTIYGRTSGTVRLEELEYYPHRDADDLNKTPTVNKYTDQSLYGTWTWRGSSNTANTSFGANPGYTTNSFVVGNSTGTGRLHVKGAGNTSSTWTSQFHNSAGNNNAFMIRDDGYIGIGTASPTSFLHMIKTNPATGNFYGGFIDITSAGTTGEQSGLSIAMKAGATGNTIATYGFGASNNSTSSGNSLTNGQDGYSMRAGYANLGGYAYAIGTNTGQNYGGEFFAGNASRNIGSFNSATVAKASATNIGTFSVARNTNATSTVQIGGYFTLLDSNAMPTFESAALIADNAGTTSPIFLARDRGTTVFSINDGGGVVAGGKSIILGNTGTTRFNILSSGGYPRLESTKTDGTITTQWITDPAAGRSIFDYSYTLHGANTGFAIRSTINDDNATVFSVRDSDGDMVLSNGGYINAKGYLVAEKTFTYDGLNSNTISASACTVDWTSGNLQSVTLNSNVTFTFTAPTGPSHLTLKITHAANTTTYTTTWPASVKWPGGTAYASTSTSGAVDIITFFYDGTNYYAMPSNDFK